MPDIQLRFNKDMLVLSAPLDASLARQGIDAARDRQYLNLMEPDAIADVLRFEQLAGAQCLVAATEDITRSRLAHVHMENDAGKLAKAAVDVVAGLKPQHVIVEIGPCGLPLDPSSKASLNENRAQYADAARAFSGCEIDAFLLSGFASLSDMKCALMGVAQASSKPVFASMIVGNAEDVAPVERVGSAEAPVESAPAIESAYFGDYVPVEPLPSPPAPVERGACLDVAQWEEAVDVMADLGAAVVGFETGEPIEQAVALAEAAVRRTALPVLAQLRVSGELPSGAARGLVPLDDVREYTADTLGTAAVRLYGAGVQFLRATGEATPACTGALAATVSGLDVRALA